MQDEALPAVLRVIQQAEKALKDRGHQGPILLAQPPEQYPKGIHALGGKVLLGLDAHNDSFDGWTDELVFKAREFLKAPRQDSPQELRAALRDAMVKALKEVRGESVGPGQFLSPPAETIR